jgi:hypothetical protein
MLVDTTEMHSRRRGQDVSSPGGERDHHFSNTGDSDKAPYGGRDGEERVKEKNQDEGH